MGRLQVSARIYGGPGPGVPLLLINGLNRAQTSWGALLAALPGRMIITFDAPGSGSTPAPIRPLTLCELADIAVSILNAAGVEKADVLGFSHGGAVAQQLAYGAADRLRRLILAATSCGVGSIPGRLRTVVHSGGPAGGGPAWRIPEVIGALWGTLAISAWSSIPLLASITAPTLVVAGAGDQIVPPNNARLLARRIPDARLVIIPGGHDLQRGRAVQSLAREIDCFIPVTKELIPT